ncbi:MAG: Rdx family protein [Ktedonobacterales bacterium]
MAQHLVKVSITYCSECGYEPQTLALAEALMKQCGHELAEIKLIPWDEGSFDVTVDGELVHSMYREGGFPTHDTVIEAIRRHRTAA